MLALRTLLPALAVGLVMTTSGSPVFADQGGVYLGAARAAAIRECNDQASKYAQYVWGVTQLHIYRTCMAAHHQTE